MYAASTDDVYLSYWRLQYTWFYT